MRTTSACSADLVLDTNVLSHADNPASSSQQSALEVIEWMRDSTVFWILDDNGKNQPDPFTSQLYAEYTQTLSPMGASLQLFIACLAGGRIRFAPRPGEALRNNVRKLVPKNKKDQVILGATAGTEDKVLVSNDEDDFHTAARKDIHKKLAVTILRSEDFFD